MFPIDGGFGGSLHGIDQILLVEEVGLGDGGGGKETGGSLEALVFADSANGVGEPILFDVKLREGLFEHDRADGGCNQQHGVGDPSAEAYGCANGDPAGLEGGEVLAQIGGAESYQIASLATRKGDGSGFAFE